MAVKRKSVKYMGLTIHLQSVPKEKFNLQVFNHMLDDDNYNQNIQPARADGWSWYVGTPGKRLIGSGLTRSESRSLAHAKRSIREHLKDRRRWR